jgi:hypothetical protein
MASSPRSREREAERRLNLQTLAIASAASATAAAVTSQLWIAGTWIAAAVTPVFVTLLSELLRRPTERIAQVLTTDDAAVPDPAAPAPRDSPESQSVRGPGVERPPGPPPAIPVSPPDPDAPHAGAAGPVRVYRQPSRRPPRRKIAYGVVAATAGIAFVIGVVVFTTTELLAGESIGKSGNRTTLLGGNDKNKTSEPDERQRTTPTDTEEQEQDQDQDQEQGTSTEEQPPPATETTTVPTTPTPRTTTEPAPTAEPPPGGAAPSETTPAP